MKSSTTAKRVVLVVDDNRLYREAMARNLRFAGYEVLEAGNSGEAVDVLTRQAPEVVITDLDMQTRTEGLDLIRQVKGTWPHVPVIMISAVGTFDEGALAQEYGATKVLSKSRIDEEIGTLYQTLDTIYPIVTRLRELRESVEAGDVSAAPELRSLVTRGDIDIGIKSVVFDLLARLEPQAASGGGAADAQAEQQLRAELPVFDQLNEETRAMLRTAEVMFTAQDEDAGDPGALALTRNMGFSYSFAVENEVKHKLGRRIAKFLNAPEAAKAVAQLYDSSLNSLELGFNQYLILTERNVGPELNADITRQVLERMRQHGSRYKPDGLKALGVILFCFGREYTFKGLKKSITIDNPLTLKGIEGDDVVKFAYALVLLQHLRNPYIHPEFSEREKIGSIREAALACLGYVVRVV